MIPIFRKIRKKMADDNEPMKYARYAIGEILLVVIGILIALQINNWNEERKESLAIKNVLIEIKEDLIEDRAELERNIELRTADFEAQKRIINVLETNSSFNENVRSDLGRIHLARNVFSASKGYDLLKELNLGALRDKELRVLLTRYYERDIAWVHREYADDKMEFENFWLPYARMHFKEWVFGGTYTTTNGEYSENIEFFSRDDAKVGTILKFNYSLVDSKWHHSGLSSKGDPIHEIWSVRE